MRRAATRSLGLTPVRATRRVGVEQELRLWRGDTQVDFRELLPELAGNLVSRDPGDPRARRLPSGLALTADGKEAELATPPFAVSAAVAERIDEVLAVERAGLYAAAAAVGVDRMSGFSTHVNVTVPDAAAVELGLRFVHRCAVALAVLSEPHGSLGILVRPRRGRLELGTEYLEGVDLRRVITFAVAVMTALESDTGPPELDPSPAVPAREKLGWHVPVEGLVSAALDDPDLARAHLRQVWAWARPYAATSGIDPRCVDDVVDGAPLRAERRADPSGCGIGTQHHIEPAPYDVGPRTRAGGVKAETAWLTWQHVVWELHRGRRSVFAVLRTDQEAEFLARLDDGAYDDALRDELGRRVGRRRLTEHGQLAEAGWWHGVRPEALVPAERDPDGRPMTSERPTPRLLRGLRRYGGSPDPLRERH